MPEGYALSMLSRMVLLIWLEHVLFGMIVEGLGSVSENKQTLAEISTLIPGFHLF